MDTEGIVRAFRAPPAALRGAPFWSWNGELREGELVRQVRVMREMGFGGFFMHSRAGLITEYLGDEWFDLVNRVADAGAAEGMEAWLYDEDRWPSGSAGGMATRDPRYRMKSLYLFEAPVDRDEPREGTVALFVGKTDGANLWAYREVAPDPERDEGERLSRTLAELSAAHPSEPGAWRALRFAVVPDPCSSGYNGATYLDTLNREATDRFLELTHERYAARAGARLGRSIRGIFTDEPHRGHCLDNRVERDGVASCAVFWTDDILEEFRKRYGSDLRPILPELFYRFRGESVSPVKLRYLDLGNQLFLERFVEPINDWCRAHGIDFTGHFLHEDSLTSQTVPAGSLMRLYEHMGRPGVDCLTEHNRCYWIVKQLSSVARQTGARRLLSELYGCTGWQFDFKGHKAVGDWQALFGVNFRCPHLSWYTMEGESKRDYPASILHQSPWYRDYAAVETYFARFGLVMAEGEPACDVLLLNPIESVWCQVYAGWANWLSAVSPDVAPYERRYAELFHMLTDRRIDFDYGEEEMLARLASAERDGSGRAVLRVGRMRYHVVIVSNMLTIRPSTLALLRAFLAQGGRVIFAGDPPAYVDAVVSDEPRALSALATAVPFDGDALAAAVRLASDDPVSVTDRNGEAPGTILAQARRAFGGTGYAAVVLNTDRDRRAEGLTLTLRAGSAEGLRAEEWDMETGQRYDASAMTRISGGEARVSLDLEAAGSRCFVLSPLKDELPPVTAFETVAEARLDGTFDYRTDEGNVCVLDYASWRFDGGDWQAEEEVLRVDAAVRDRLGLEHRGGGMVQPWYARLHDEGPYGRLELRYEFLIDDLPEGDVYLAGERPELFGYAINGVPLRAGGADDFWVDDCFKRMRVPEGALRQGRNVVTASADFRRTTNVEALYLVGAFGVTLEGRRRTLVRRPAEIGFGDYARYAMPFYTGCMTYRIPPERYRGLLGRAGEEADRVVLSPASFTGACVRVTALGQTRILGWPPYEADVTEAYRAGAPIEATVVGTRRNVFGPLHQIPAIAGAYGPGNFMTTGAGWTEGYSLIGSGLTGLVLRAQKGTAPRRDRP